jgi:hypothetical protein
MQVLFNVPNNSQAGPGRLDLSVEALRQLRCTEVCPKFSTESVLKPDEGLELPIYILKSL